MGFAPEEFTPEQKEKAKDLFAQGTSFVLGVAKLEQLPLCAWPEAAFAGRSNVGKSSIINAVTGQKGLAKTSNTPGRTQQLNYFNLAENSFGGFAGLWFCPSAGTSCQTMAKSYFCLSARTG